MGHIPKDPQADDKLARQRTVFVETRGLLDDECQGSDDAFGVAWVRQPCPVLVALRGPRTGDQFPLDRETTTIGRSSANAIVLDDPTVSRHHADIQQDRDGAVIVDSGSLNGVYVNHTLCIDSARLTHGDEIQIGVSRFLFLAD